MPAQQGTLAEITGVTPCRRRRSRTSIVALSLATLRAMVWQPHCSTWQTASSSAPPPTVRVTGPDRLDLAGTVTSTAYRILRRDWLMCENMSHADNVTITVTDHADTVTIRLIDDGIGDQQS